VVSSATIAAADDCEDWITVEDAAPLLVSVENDVMDSVFDMDDWAVELGAAENKIVVDDEGEEGTELLIEDWVVEDGALDGTTLLDNDWRVELGAPEAKEIVEAGAPGRELLLEDKGPAGSELLVEEEGEPESASLVVNDGNEISELLVVEVGSAERLLLIEDVGETSQEMLVDDRVSELGAPEGGPMLANADERDSRSELLDENWELSAAEDREVLDNDESAVELGAPNKDVLLAEDSVMELGTAAEGKVLLAGDAWLWELGAPESKVLVVEEESAAGKELRDENDGVVELWAAEGKVEVDAPPMEEEAAPENVELSTPEGTALLVVDICDEITADCWLVERLDDWAELGAANWPLIEVIWEVAAPVSVIEDDDSRLDELAAPEYSVLALLAADTCDDEIEVLAPGAFRPDELVWAVDVAAKMDVEEDREPQSVAETVRVTVRAALVTYDV
jgi:hypothetical protein